MSRIRNEKPTSNWRRYCWKGSKAATRKILVFYRHADSRLEVVRVVHGSRDLPQLFGRPT